MKKSYILMIFVALVIFGCANSNNPVDIDSEDDYLHLQAFYNTVGYAKDIAFYDSLIIVAEDQGGISVYNTDNDSLLFRYTEDLSNARLVSVVPENNRLFVYDKYGSPSRIRVYRLNEFINEEDNFVMSPIIGNTGGIDYLEAYADDDNQNILHIIRNESGEHEYKIGLYDDFYFTEIENYSNYDYELGGFDYDEDYTYLAYSQLGLNIAVNEDSILTNIDTQGEAMDVSVVDTIAFIADRTEGVSIIDISDIYNPLNLFRYDTSGYAQSVAVKDNYLALGSGGGGVYLFDITDIDAVEFLARIDDDEIGYTYRVEIKENYIYAVTKRGVAKLQILE